MQNIKDHLREDIEKVNEPQLKVTYYLWRVMSAGVTERPCGRAAGTLMTSHPNYCFPFV